MSESNVNSINKTAQNVNTNNKIQLELQNKIYKLEDQLKTEISKNDQIYRDFTTKFNEIDKILGIVYWVIMAVIGVIGAYIVVSFFKFFFQPQ